MPTIINGLTGIDKIQNGIINTDDIADGSVSETKLSTNAVTGTKIADGSVALSKLTPSGTSGQVLTSAGTGSAPSWVTLPALGVGVGQTWQDVTASRALATTYTNSTGKPILVIVSVQHSTNTGACNVTVGGIVVSLFQTNISYAGSMQFCQSFIVPNSTTYSVSANQTLLKWTELR